MKVLEGYVDNGQAAPLPDVSAFVTVVGDGAIVATGVTDADGHWYFDGLGDDAEYFVNLLDTKGNALVRGPWSGEIRDVWVRDRLAMPETSLAELPGSGQTTVGGLTLTLDPAAGNSLVWTATGLYVPPVPTVDLTAYYTKTESDARYAELTDVDPFPGYLTQTEGDARYPQKTDVDPYPTYLTAAEADALFLTPAEGNAAYATSAHNHDTTYVQLVGGSVMTGLLGPSTHNTRDLGTTGTRWRALYGMTGDLTTSLTVATKPVAISPDASNIVEWRANGFYAAAGAVSDIWVNTTGDTMTGDLNMTANVLPTVTNTRDLGSTTLWWRKVWANDAYFNNTPTIGASSALTVASGDATYVKLAGSTMTGDLNMTANVLPTVTNTRDLGTTALRWRKLWAVDADLSGALAVAGLTTMANTLVVTVAANTALRLRGGGANDNVQLRFMGNTTAVDQWAIGNEVSTGTVGRNFDIYDLVAGANRLRISSTGGVTIPGTLTAGQTGISSGLTVSGGINVTTGGGTISPTLYVNSRQVIMAGCRAYHNAAQTITTATLTALAFNQERYDTDTFHDLVTNNGRLTVPAGHAGKYLIWATVSWAFVADATHRLIGLRINGATQIARQSGPNLNSASISMAQNVSCVYDLAAGDYVEVVVRHERGSNLDLGVNANIDPEFGMQRVG